jgi:hypothetical protein
VEGSDLCLPQRETGVILCMYVCMYKVKNYVRLLNINIVFRLVRLGCDNMAINITNTLI